MTEYEVTRYEDLKGANLSDAGKDRVLAALDRECEMVINAEPWVIEDAGYSTLSGAETLVGIDAIDAETEKAWLVIQDGDEAWVAKSVAELYRSGAGVDRNSGSQKFLSAFEG